MYWEYARTQLESKEAVKSSNIDQVELASIIVYTGSSYDPINAFLRFGTVDKIDWQSVIDSIQRGLKKLPKFVGQVYRGAKVTKDELEKYRSKKSFEEKGFLSTSEFDYLAYRWAGSQKNEPNPGTGEARAVFFIASKTGRKIAQFSASPNEGEVLFAPSSRFRATDVVAAPENSGVDVKITLAEVDEVGEGSSK